MDAPLPEPFATWFASRGWRVHPHQLAMLAAALAGEHTLLIAPTGGGKTLAGFLPSLIALAAAPTLGLHTLYISPLKALTVDVHRNLEQPIAEMRLPVRAETRTGDTPPGKRRRQRRLPPQLLMTTPESLALLLSFADAAALFGGLACVVVDELHALAGSKRGDLLAPGLARLSALAPRLPAGSVGDRRLARVLARLAVAARRPGGRPGDRMPRRTRAGREYPGDRRAVALVWAHGGARAGRGLPGDRAGRHQCARSLLPGPDDLLIECFPRGGKQFLVAYCFEGRNAHQTLGMLLSRRMERAGHAPLGFVATDYVLALWSLRPVDDIPGLFAEDMLGDDLEEWMAVAGRGDTAGRRPASGEGIESGAAGSPAAAI